MKLNAEILCGYEVSAQMKRIWATEIDLLKDFIRVCEKYGLKYYAMGGTLLGAVRHKGFIPWDNDIDVFMPRKDFDKLLQVGAEEFQHPHFMQTPVTESNKFFDVYIKIRDDNSTAASIREYDKGINCGIFIDVFCLEELPDNILLRSIYLRKLMLIKRTSNFCFDNSNQQQSRSFQSKIMWAIRHFIYKYLYHKPNPSQLFNLYQKEAAKYNGRDNKKVALLAFAYNKNWVWDKTDWNEMITLPFMDMQLCAPKGYDNILRHQYGDYMKLPDDKSTHDYFDFNPDIPYKEYFSNKKNN